MVLKKLWTGLLDWALFTVGSSRSSALIRMGLVLNIWTRLGGQVILTRDFAPERIFLSINFFIATGLMFIGLFTRLTTFWTGLVLAAMFYYFGIEQEYEPWTHNHIYLLMMITFFSVFTPAGKSYSVDRWLAVRRAQRRGEPAPPESGNLWGLRLMALQMSAVYFWTAYDKTHAGFWSGARLEEIFMYHYFGSDFPNVLHPLFVVMAWGTLFLEYSLAVGLLFPQTRKWLIVPGLLLHAVFYVLLPIRTFSTTVFVIYLAYLNADCIHAFLDTLQGYPVAPQPTMVVEAQASALD